MKERVWSWPLAVYLFLGGVGAGMTIVAAVADIFFGIGELFALCTLISACALAIGAGCLLFELGVTMGFWRVFTWHGAVLNFGAFALGILIVLDVVYFSFFTGWFPWCGMGAGRMVLAVLCLIVGFCVIVYTGIELSSMKGRAFWNNPGLPVLFTVSGLLTGIASDSMALGLWPYMGPPLIVAVVRGVLGYVAIVFAVLTLIGMVTYVLMMRTSSDVYAQVPANRIFNGSYSVAFWLLLVVVGLVAPIVLYALGAPMLNVIAGCCVLIGGCCLRFLFVFSDDRRMLPGEEEYYDMIATGDEPFVKTNWT